MSKSSKQFFLPFIITLGVGAIVIIMCILGLSIYWLFTNNSNSATVQTNSSPNQAADTIGSVKGFENSKFCEKYECIPYSEDKITDGIDNSYTIGNYPVYNEFFIEIISNNGVINEYGLTLDPRSISSQDLEFISDFLSEISPNEVNSKIIEFVSQNLNIGVDQICKGNSIQFGTMNIWAGSIGLAPTIHVSENCGN